MYFERSDIAAIGWAAGNCWLAVAVWPQRPAPWLLILVLGSAPLLLIFCAEYIAGRMSRGWMESLASDFRKPQSPVAIRLLGWVALALQTIFLYSNH